MLYASDLMRYLGARSVQAEECPEDLPDLVARILADRVQLRIRRNLSRGYVAKAETLTRVRGRIDWFRSEREQLLWQGKIACRFQDLTVDTSRNRYVRNALHTVAHYVRDVDLAHECRQLAASLERLGVSATPDRTPLPPSDRLGRHDSGDAEMLAAARLAMDLAMPTEVEGSRRLLAPEKDVVWLRRLYENAVGGFYRHRLASPWRVLPGRNLHWPIETASEGLASILPKMITDITLEEGDARRIVIDTKFTRLLTGSQFGVERLRSHYIYQIYAYVRALEGTGDPMAAGTSGVLLHPAISTNISEEVVIHGHRLRFWTVDLNAEPKAIQARLLAVLSG
ncbi:5-methylcytosine-specific restriction endonuclease system specificity protein McrC [bacterium]|nr:MAG: 5-methylcytosine-specific restriction endonuclease system specificity protein McrC [bacterium]